MTFPRPIFLPGLSLRWLLVLGAPLAAAAGPADSAAANPPAPAMPAYPLQAYAAVGFTLTKAGHLRELGWNDEQITAFVEGVRAAFREKDCVFDDAARRLQAEIARRAAELETRERQEAAAAFAQPGRLEQYLKEMCKRHNLQRTDSGLCYNVQSGRPGIRPGPDDEVVVSCIATAADGKTRLPQLSSTHVRVKVSGVLPGFVEGFQMMTVGSQAMFILPPALSFGDHKWPDGVDRGTPLIFFVTLDEVIGAGTSP